VQKVLVELDSKPVSNDTEKTDDLSKRRIDFFPWHIDALGAAQSESTDGADLINRRNVEDFIDEGGLFQPVEQLLKVTCFRHLLSSLFLLLVQLLLVLIEITPELRFFALNQILV